MALLRKLFYTAAGTTAGLYALRKWRQPALMRFDGASVVITGGSRGLGLELARRFGAEGARLTLLARDEEELERARHELAQAGVDVQVYACDITVQAEAQRAIQYVREIRGGVDVLVNNAGVIQAGPVEHMERSDLEQALRVHAWGPFYLMQEVAPLMKEQGGGRIVNISSIGGLVAVPHLLPYVVSKFALTGLSDGMRAELAKDDIYVTTVCPGLMRTGSPVNAFFKGQHEQEFTWFSISDALPLLSMNAGRAAAQIVKATQRGQPRFIITPQARLLHALNALVPGVVADLMAVATRLLPGPTGAEGDRRRKGWASQSAAAPSFLTYLGDKAAERNNELHGEAEVAYRPHHGSSGSEA